MNTKIAHHEIIAKRLRNERVELFARLTQAEKALRGMLDHLTQKVIARVVTRGQTLAGLASINQTLHAEIVSLRGSLRVWMGSLIRDAIKMGFRHPGDALKPVFKANQESLVTEIVAEQALFEAKLSGKLFFNMDSTFAKQAMPYVITTSARWKAIGKQIAGKLTRTNKATGIKISERIWELTARTEMDMKRIIASGIAQGRSPYEIAKQIEKYVSPRVGAADELGIQTGPGVYRSPYRNAMRLARTETNRAYTQASSRFYQNKPWVSEVDVTLSPDHDVTDDCDDLVADNPYTPEEADTLLPVHPHCMCYLSPRIDPKYLGEEEPTDEEGGND